MNNNPSAASRPNNLKNYPTQERGACRTVSVGCGRVVAGILLTYIIIVSAQTVFAQSKSSREDLIKAAFVYRLSKFVEWPAENFERADSPFVIGVLGKGSFAEVLARKVDGKKAKGRNIVVRRVRQLTTAEDLADCHVLFVPSTEQEQVAQEIRAVLQDASILTIGDVEGFSRKGGIIGFSERDNKMSFEINLDSARRANLKIQAKLLKIGQIVKDSDNVKRS